MTLASLNDIDIFACIVRNAYLNPPSCEKIWFAAVQESAVKITRVLYGLKSSRASWRATLNKSLLDMGFHYTVAILGDFPMIKCNSGGFKYYTHILVNVNNVLIVPTCPTGTPLFNASTHKLNPTCI
jgi:hypothetical protein